MPEEKRPDKKPRKGPSARIRLPGTEPPAESAPSPPAVSDSALEAPSPRRRTRVTKEPSTDLPARIAKPRAKRSAPSPKSPPPKDANERRLSVLMVTPEAHPFAKTGGLAEVTAALSDALARLGHAVTLVLPRYRSVDLSGGTRLETTIAFGDRTERVAYLEKPLASGVSLVLVDVPELFERDGLYGTASGDFPDNARRFGVFCRAAVEYPRLKAWRPSVVHAHDWQSGLVPVYQKMLLSSDPYIGGVPAVFTLHNLAFQGVFPASTLPALGLGWNAFDVQALEFWGSISFLKGGINFSEKITTVSPGYAKEIVQPELGFGFEGVLARRAADLVGILNGIDVTRWTPSGDPFVPASFSAGDPSGKLAAKRALLTDVALASDDRALERPLIGLISRLTDQKGFDLIVAASDDLMALDASWVMLGSGERRFEDHWRTLAARHPDRVSATIGFDERLAHLIEAGADLFLMPSRFEPCGLNQLYSLRYGTVPIVRATGGLDDTVEDVDASSDTGTGFKFADYTPAAMVAAVRRALTAFRNKALWKGIQERGMRKDHSWDASAQEYVKLYEDMAART
jgi:starch synthase